MQFDKNEITPEWWDLVDEYPEIFLDPSPEVLGWFEECQGARYFTNKKEDLVNLRFGFECDIGWKEIIREFCADVRKLVEKARANGHEIHHKTFILKEKFGSLRNQGCFYGPDKDLYKDEFYKLDNELEDKSMKTCELTGKPGKVLTRNGWWKTLCEEKALKLGFK